MKNGAIAAKSCCVRQEDIVTLMKLFFPIPGVFYREVAPCDNM